MSSVGVKMFTSILHIINFINVDYAREISKLWVRGEILFTRISYLMYWVRMLQICLAVIQVAMVVVKPTAHFPIL